MNYALPETANGRLVNVFIFDHYDFVYTFSAKRLVILFFLYHTRRFFSNYSVLIYILSALLVFVKSVNPILSPHSFCPYSSQGFDILSN